MTRVLVVDDEPQILRALRINLRARQYDVAVAASGAQALDETMAPRAALYQVFHAVWQSTGARLESQDKDRPATTPGERLMRIAPRSRQAFLLTAVEGWMAGPRLAALIAARDGALSVGAIAADPIVADYLRDEVLATM